MCGPAAGLMVAATAMQAYGQMQAGRAARKAAEFSAQQNELNAGLAEKQVAGVRLQGELRADQIRRDGSRQIGAATAATAAGNVDVSVGTPVFRELETRDQISADAMAEKYNAGQREAELRAEAVNRRNQAAIDRAAGRQAQRAGNMAAFGSLLSGAATSSYYGKRGI